MGLERAGAVVSEMTQEPEPQLLHAMTNLSVSARGPEVPAPRTDGSARGLWRIELLGGLCASQGDRVVTHFRSRKAAALLAYLAFYRDRLHAREELIELLWPETEPDRSRNNLSRELSWLRDQLEPAGTPRGAVLLTDRSFVQLSPTAVSTDVARFQALLKEARAGPVEEQSRCLAAAVELYRGELLPGQFQEWVLAERRRLEEEFVQALRQLTALSEQAGDLSRAIDWAARLVAADPLSEESQYEQIRLLAAAGKPTAALRQYQELERLLEQQLADAPSPRSRALAQQIQDQLPGTEHADREPGQPRGPLSGLRAHPRLAPVPLPAGTVTFLYTDVEASTATWEGAGPPFLEAMSSHDRMLRQCFHRHDGYEANAMGEGFLVAFQDAGAALACAVEAQRALAAHAWPEAVGPLRVRMALHTAFDAEPIGGVYRLIELHHGERMVKAAHGGQLLCSQRTADLLRPGLGKEIQLVDLGLYRLRGVSQPARLFQVEYPEMAQREFPPPDTPRAVQGFLPPSFTRFIGREPEIAQLCLAFGSRLPAPGRGGAEAAGAVHESQEPGAERGRLITLTGPGGTGKTRLALEVARRLWNAFDEAVWFVRLSDLTDPQLIVERVLETLRLPRSRSLPPLEQIAVALSDQPALLVLDNYEHLAAEGAAVVQTLLDRLEGLTVLVTSRQRLHLDGEREFRVPPLPVPVGGSWLMVDGPAKTESPTPSTPPASRVPDHPPSTLLQWPSVQLFLDRAQAVDAGFQVTERNAAAVAALCAQLEGVPLALEMAAARADVLTPAQILEQLSHRLDFLESRQRDVDPRQRSMRATYEWSYQLLPPELRRYFARLSVFRGGCTLEAAQAVCEDGPPQRGVSLQYLSALLDSSLVISESLPSRHRASDVLWDVDKSGVGRPAATELGGRSSGAASGAPCRPAEEEKRFRLREIVREYAAEQISLEERASTLQRHAGYYLGLAERAGTEIAGEAKTEWLDRLEREHGNLMVALTYEEPATDSGSSAIPPDYPPRWGPVVEALAPAYRYLGRPEAAWALLEAYRSLCERTGYTPGLVRAYMRLGRFLPVNPRPGEGSQTMFERGLAAAEASGRRDLVILAQSCLAEELARTETDLERAEAMARACLQEAGSGEGVHAPERDPASRPGSDVSSRWWAPEDPLIRQRAYTALAWVAARRVDLAAFRSSFHASLAYEGIGELSVHAMLDEIETSCHERGADADFVALCQDLAAGYARAGLEPAVQHWHLEPASPGSVASEPTLRESFTGPDWHPSWRWRDITGRSALDRTTRPGWLGLRPAMDANLFPYYDLAAPRLLMPISGEFTAQTLVELQPSALTLAILLLWRDERHFVRLDLGRRFGSSRRYDVRLEACLDGRYQVIGRGQWDEPRIWLRLERTGAEVRSLCGADGERWLTCGSLGFPLGADDQIGLAAIHHGPGALAWFDSFLLWRR
jgi:predicted ATPase/DNA-binding SARP family transcriptional activator/class 3 adenylate cyclase